jgi:hypothetical protein
MKVLVSDAGLSLLALVYVALGHIGSFLDVGTLYPASGALATFLLSGFIPSKCVPLSLTFYSPAHPGNSLREGLRGPKCIPSKLQNRD